MRAEPRPGVPEGEGEGDDAPLDDRAGGVGEAPVRAVPRPEQLEAVPLGLALPAVEVEWWMPMARQAARTLPSSSARATAQTTT